MIDLLLICLPLTLIGGALADLLPPTVSRSARALVAPALGWYAYIAVSMVSFTLLSAVWPMLILVVLAVAALCSLVLRRSSPQRPIWGGLAGVGAGFVALTATITAFVPPVLTFDSFVFLELEAELRAGLLEPGNARLMSYPFALTDALALSGGLDRDLLVSPITAATLLVFAAAGIGTARRSWRAWLLIAVAVCIAAASYMPVLQLSYVNSHALFAGAITLVFVLGRQLAAGHGAAAVIPVGVASAAASAARLEGVLIVGLVLIAIIGSARITTRQSAVLGATALVPPAVYFCPLVFTDSAGIVSGQQVGVMLAAAAVPLIANSIPAAQDWLADWAPVLTLCALILAFVGLSVSDPDRAAAALATMLSNLAATGAWGPFWWFALPAVLGLALFGPSLRDETSWVLVVIGGIVLTAMLAILRDPPIRTGFGDSVNRMMVHFAPLSVFYIASKFELASPALVGARAERGDLELSSR